MTTIAIELTGLYSNNLGLSDALIEVSKGLDIIINIKFSNMPVLPDICNLCSNIGNIIFSKLSIFNTYDGITIISDCICNTHNYHYSNQLKSIVHLIGCISNQVSLANSTYLVDLPRYPSCNQEYWYYVIIWCLIKLQNSVYLLMGLLAYFLQWLLNHKFTSFIISLFSKLRLIKAKNNFLLFIISLFNRLSTSNAISRYLLFIVSFFNTFVSSNAQINVENSLSTSTQNNLYMSKNMDNSSSTSTQNSSNLSIIIYYLSIICWFLYIGIYLWYDITFIGFIDSYPGLGLFNYRNATIPYFLHRTMLSIIFLLTINMGVLYSTAFWYRVTFSVTRNNVIFCLFSFALSYLASVAWITLYRFRIRLSVTRGNIYYPYITSLIIRSERFLPYIMALISLSRAIVESIAFNFISWYNFWVWENWATIPYANLLAIIIGTLLYIPIGTYQTYLEFRLSRYWLYGFIYQLSFSLLSFTTSGWFYLYTQYRTPTTDIVVYVITIVLTLIFPLEIYREVVTNVIILGTDNNIISLWDCIFAALRYYITFLSFVLHTSAYLGYLFS